MKTIFVFDGHDYTLDGGALFDGQGEIIGTVTLDEASEYWHAESIDGQHFARGHANQYDQIDMAKTMISGMY